MKTLYTKLVALSLVLVLASCSATSDDGDKNAKLKKLKAQQAEITKQILQLEKDIAKENPDAVANLKAKEVSVTEIKSKNFEHYVQTQGAVESENNILVSAKVPGVVTQIFVSEGQQVTKGQTLAQLDNAVMARSIESMESQLELATSVYERQENLWKQKIGTEVQYLQAKTNKESLEKQLASLREQSDMYRIKAPITGIIDEMNLKVGEAAQPGLPAARVINGNDLKLVANVSEAYVTQIKKGNKAVVSIPELKKDLQAKVTFVGRNIDQFSRTFTVEINLPSEENLRPNMTATVKVVFENSPSALVVPVNVIQTVNDEKIVYVADTTGKQAVARKKVITVGGIFGNQAEVKGLSDGDKLITFGYQGLSDGAIIKI